MTLMGSTTIGGREEMRMLSLMAVEAVHLAKLCAVQFAL
jgi:hypothetical protein